MYIYYLACKLLHVCISIFIFKAVNSDLHNSQPPAYFVPIPNFPYEPCLIYMCRKHGLCGLCLFTSYEQLRRQPRLITWYRQKGNACMWQAQSASVVRGESMVLYRECVQHTHSKNKNDNVHDAFIWVEIANNYK